MLLGDWTILVAGLDQKADTCRVCVPGKVACASMKLMSLKLVSIIFNLGEAVFFPRLLGVVYAAGSKKKQIKNPLNPKGCSLGYH